MFRVTSNACVKSCYYTLRRTHRKQLIWKHFPRYEKSRGEGLDSIALFVFMSFNIWQYSNAKSPFSFVFKQMLRTMEWLPRYLYSRLGAACACLIARSIILLPNECIYKQDIHLLEIQIQAVYGKYGMGRDREGGMVLRKQLHARV